MALGGFQCRAFQQNAYQNDCAPAVDTSTPGFAAWARVARRRLLERDPEPATTAQEPSQQPDHSAYYRESARLAKAIAEARNEASELRLQVAALEAAAAAALDAERARAEHALLLAQQRLLLISVQEAAFREEVEAVDVAFIAVVTLETMQ